MPHRHRRDPRRRPPHQHLDLIEPGGALLQVVQQGFAVGRNGAQLATETLGDEAGRAEVDIDETLGALTDLVLTPSVTARGATFRCWARASQVARVRCRPSAPNASA